MLFPNIVLMSFTGLSGVYLEVKYLECIHNLFSTNCKFILYILNFYDTFHFNENILTSFWKFQFKMVLFYEMTD